MHLCPLSAFLLFVAFIGVILGIRIERRYIHGINTISLYPNRLLAESSQVLFLSCPYAAIARKENLPFLDDEHFCSILGDKGHVVHCLESADMICSSFGTISRVLTAVIEQLSITEEKSIVVVSNELGSLLLLRLLSQVGQWSSGMVQQLVLIDPPPLHSVTSEIGRRHILQRYFPKIARVALTGTEGSFVKAEEPALSSQSDEQQLLLITVQQELDILRRGLMHGERDSQLKVAKEIQRSNAVSMQGWADAHPAPASKKANNDPEFLRLSILAGLEKGTLSTSELLGTGLPTRTGELKQLSDKGGIQVIYSGALDRQQCCSLSTLQSGGATTSSNTRHLGTHDTFALDNRAYNVNVGEKHDKDGYELLASADQWGLAAVEEVADIYNALPVCTFASDNNHRVKHHSVNFDIERHEFLADAISIVLK